MNAQERISKLQGLLARIQRNAAQPRVTQPAVMAPPVSATPIELTPPAAAAPEPALVAPPPSLISAADQSVDELLGVSTSSEAQVDVEVTLDSFAPPPAETGEAEPIPLVSVATSQPEPPPPPALDDVFALESEVSEVRITTGLREPEAEVTVAAIEAEAEPISPEELSEEDLVEVTEVVEEAPAAVATDLDIDFVDEDEQPPASSKRSKVATSMDEALASAAAQLEAEREVPIKTPPPESGPQQAPPPQALTAPPTPDVDALMGAELDIPTLEPKTGPTPEQLGQTIDLEEARGPALELAEAPAEPPPPLAVEELEVALPGRDVSGGYDENLMPPPEARDDLEAHRRRLEEDVPPPPESLAQLPSVQPGPPLEPLAAAPAPPALLNVGPEVGARPAPAVTPETFTSTRVAFSPRSFSELLDASLALNGD